jgi:hypothetical protein
MEPYRQKQILLFMNLNPVDQMMSAQEVIDTMIRVSALVDVPKLSA